MELPGLPSPAAQAGLPLNMNPVILNTGTPQFIISKLTRSQTLMTISPITYSFPQLQHNQLHAEQILQKIRQQHQKQHQQLYQQPQHHQQH